MIPALSDPANIFISVSAGALLILVGWFNQPLQRRFGIRPASELYSVPRLKRSARITEQLGRFFLILIGIFLISEGVGPRVLSIQAAGIVSMTLVGLAGLIALAMIGVTLAHWRA
jgi:hypothetical protein